MSVTQVSKFTYTSSNLLLRQIQWIQKKWAEIRVKWSFLVSVKAVTLIFISGRYVVRLFHLLKKGNQVLSNGKELLSCFSQANKEDFHENPDHIYTELTLINPLSVYYKKSYAFVVCCNIWRPFDIQCRSRTDCFYQISLVWVHTVCFYIYVNQKQTFFGCSYFAGVLRVISYDLCLQWGVLAHDDSYFRIKPRLIFRYYLCLQKVDQSYFPIHKVPLLQYPKFHNRLYCVLWSLSISYTLRVIS